MDNQLVKLQENKAFTDSMIIAKGTENEHHAVRELIKRYKEDIEDFGTLLILNEKSNGGRPLEIFLLNEEQATFLMTLLRNSKKSVLFKKELVRQFYAMRQFIFERQGKDWIVTREQGKITRKAETDTLKCLIDYAKEQGSTHSEKIYLAYTKLSNKICGISGRDNATVEQLSSLTVAENIILHCVQVGIQEEKHYKDIYKECKRRLEMFKDIAYLDFVA